MTARMHPTKPIADGIPFDDTAGMGQETKDLLYARGVVFATRFRAAGIEYGGAIIATSWPAAEEIAFARGLDEEVIGVLVASDPLYHERQP